MSYQMDNVNIDKRSVKTYNGTVADNRVSYSGHAKNESKIYHQEGAETIYNSDVNSDINTFNGGQHAHNSGCSAGKQWKRRACQRASAPSLNNDASHGPVPYSQESNYFSGERFTQEPSRYFPADNPDTLNNTEYSENENGAAYVYATQNTAQSPPDPSAYASGAMLAMNSPRDRPVGYLRSDGTTSAPPTSQHQQYQAPPATTPPPTRHGQHHRKVEADWQEHAHRPGPPAPVRHVSASPPAVRQDRAQGVPPRHPQYHSTEQPTWQSQQSGSSAQPYTDHCAQPQHGIIAEGWADEHVGREFTDGAGSKSGDWTERREAGPNELWMDPPPPYQR